MALSPGVDIREIDLTTIVPAVSTSIGGMGGVFSWGPVESPELISSEDELVRRYATPNQDNFETWFVASSFLTYSNALYVSRAASANTEKTTNAVAGPYGSEHVGVLIKNENDFEIQLNEPEGSPEKIDYWAESNNAFFIARYPGSHGNSLRVLVCDSPDAYSSEIRISGNTDYANSEITTTFTRGSNIANVTVKAANTDVALDVAEIFIGVGPNSDSNPKTTLNVLDYVRVGDNEIGFQYLQVEKFVKSDGLYETEITFDDDTGEYTWDGSDYSFDSVEGVGVVTFSIKFKTRFYLAADDPVALTVSQGASNMVRFWEGFNLVSGSPGTSNYAASVGSQGDELHIVVVDENGVFSNGTKNTILEVFDRVSRIKEAVNTEGGSLYYPEVLRQTSRYIYSVIPNAVSSNEAPSFAGRSETEGNLAPLSTQPFSVKFYKGKNEDKENNIPLSALAKAYDVYKSPEDIDVSILITGKSVHGIHGEGLARYISDNIVDFRKDCVFTVSPQFNDVVRNPFSRADDVVEFRNALGSTSYGIMDSGYKLMYDRYNDVRRYVPLCGDTAGLMAYTDEIRDPWFSPAGFNRGNIRNIIKQAYNPNKTDRDFLYPNGVNPVVTFPGQGTVLYGDKTLLSKPSAFDRINVRRLFIVLEKAIARFAKFSLFELNDAVTRAAFRNAVEPYLRNIQGRRGIYEFKVICDETNNTGEVIDRNEFVGDIFIKPSRSINFVRLNFIAVRTDVEFNEIVGEF